MVYHSRIISTMLCFGSFPFRKRSSRRMVRSQHDHDLHHNDDTIVVAPAATNNTIVTTNDNSHIPTIRTFSTFTISHGDLPDAHHSHVFARHAADGSAGGGGGSSWERKMTVLPMRTSLPDGTEVIVDILSDHRQVTEVVNMIQDAAQRDEGYVMDDITSEKEFITEIQRGNGQVFRVASVDKNKTLVAFIILDSNFYRGQRTVADSYLIVRRGERRKGIGEWGMKMTLQLAKRMGYIAIYGDTFSENVAMTRIFENCGFQKVGHLPITGRAVDGKTKSSSIFFRELGNLDDAPKSPAPVSPRAMFKGGESSGSHSDSGGGVSNSTGGGGMKLDGESSGGGAPKVL